MNLRALARIESLGRDHESLGDERNFSCIAALQAANKRFLTATADPLYS